jgi:hypothetical protein
MYATLLKPGRNTICEFIKESQYCMLKWAFFWSETLQVGAWGADAYWYKLGCRFVGDICYTELHRQFIYFFLWIAMVWLTPWQM